MTKQEREQVLREKLQTMQVYERDLRAAGKRCIAGVDEVGRGPLAGPVVAACVVCEADQNSSVRSSEYIITRRCTRRTGATAEKEFLNGKKS